ncbi:hypothetical protein M011DRAFT_487382 [Sporormia fimetaria CBS 119925]|uniref:Uncharacterized protein n=1 Tax=Sporormia fimetaria CBS 119925 TaxID=1340428 RepID=A0A6A6VAB8_9PLEO|nr:hypothetical protein M011DRAFT_487382 [Sporormia fimetaria CBS 119925]
MFLRPQRLWHVERISRVSLRSFSRQSRRPPSHNCAIIIPSSVTRNANPRTLIGLIEPIDRKFFPKDRTIVLLLTPAFAAWALDDAAFLKGAVRHAFRNVFNGAIAEPNTEIEACVAVVDKLPAPHDPDRVTVGTYKPYPVPEPGYEGLAYITLKDGELRHRTECRQDEKGCLTFTTRGATGSEAQILRLPLANTVFQTGTPTTILRTIWQLAKSTNELSLLSKTQLPYLGLNLENNPASERRSTLTVPLVPLTVPRKVLTGMGNIISRVAGPNDASVTASAELELAVPRYFAARKESAQAITVWALVIPANAADSVTEATYKWLDPTHDREDIGEPSWETLWKSEPPPWNDSTIMSALAKGARLHRVLSGGGGWGKKAGLLSLDPWSLEHGAKPDDTWDDTTSFEGLSSALKEAVNDGDYIQFFVCPSTTGLDASDATPNIERLEETKGNFEKNGRLSSWEFGCIPSTTDDVKRSWQLGEKERIYNFVECFGALTEGGMTVHKLEGAQDDDPSCVGETKIDVPFSRFSSVELVKRTFDPSPQTKSPRDSKDYMLDHLDTTKGVARRAFSTQTVSSSPERQDLPPIRRVVTESPQQAASTPETERHDLPPIRRVVTESPQQAASIPEITTAMNEVAAFSPVRRVISSSVDTAMKESAPFSPVRRVISSSVDTQPAKKSRRKRARTPQNITTEPRIPLRKYVDRHVSEADVIERRFHGIEEVIQTLKAEMPRWSEALLTWRTNRILQETQHALRRWHQNTIKRTMSQAEVTVSTLSTLDRELQHLFLDTNPFVAIQTLSNTLDQLSLSTQQREQEVSRIEHLSSLRAHLIAETNSSAIEVYILHTLLRRRMGRLIRDPLTGFEARDMLVDGKRHLAMFNENLFVGFTAPSHRYFRDRLEELQHERPEDLGLPAKGQKDYYIRRVHIRRDEEDVKDAARWGTGDNEEFERDALGVLGPRKTRKEAKRELWEEISSWLN